MFFDDVPEASPDPIFGLAGAFRADPRPHKIDLLVGIYRNEHLQPELLPSVKKATELQSFFPADYLPIDGMGEFLDLLGALAFGEKRWKEIHGRTYSAQVAGGTAALRIGADFLSRGVTQKIYLPQPTWPNHRSIFERAGFQIHSYPYYHKESHKFDLATLCRSIEEMSEKSSLLLHVACHNPTGCDPTEAEWREISRLIKKKGVLPFFDFAYQGFGEGVAEDRFPLEIFLEEGHEMVVAYSCSKNFSLYQQRVGALFVVDTNSGGKARVGSQIKQIIRSLYSNPPAYGARIAWEILKTPHLRTEWEKELGAMRRRIQAMRKLLVDQLSKQTSHFEFLRNHKGMFSFADLDPIQVKRMVDEYGIYLIGNGRISIAGLNSQNIDSVVHALIEVSR